MRRFHTFLVVAGIHGPLWRNTARIPQTPACRTRHRARTAGPNRRRQHTSLSAVRARSPNGRSGTGVALIPPTTGREVSHPGSRLPQQRPGRVARRSGARPTRRAVSRPAPWRPAAAEPRSRFESAAEPRRFVPPRADDEPKFTQPLLPDPTRSRRHLLQVVPPEPKRRHQWIPPRGYAELRRVIGMPSGRSHGKQRCSDFALCVATTPH